MHMSKKNAIVVGGSGGIGAEVVRVLSTKGFRVSFTYLRNKDAATQLQSSTKEATGYPMDLRIESSVREAVSHMLTDHGEVDAVVYSVTPPILNKNILFSTGQEHLAHWQLQTQGLLSVVQALKERILQKKKLKFIIIGTEYCIGRPPAGLSHYVQAKYSLLGLAKSMAVDLAKYCCTVNVVSPGMVQTPLIAHLPPKLIEVAAETNPLKRIATPQDIAALVAFLAEDTSDYLNGVNITVNGGSAML